MKFPSVGELLSRSGATLRRFPFVLFTAAAGTAAGIALVEIEPSAASWSWLTRVALGAVCGIPLLLTTALLRERWQWRKGIALPVTVAALAALMAYTLSFPRDIFAGPELHAIRFWLLVAGLHFLVAFAPFAGVKGENAFWQYNRTLFLRFLTAALYSAVLYAGLSVAILSVEKLFNLEISSDRYLQLWLLVAGVFNTWFFLAGVPGTLAALEGDDSYPKGLRVFVRFVLLPLVAVYLIILYAYEVKILLAWDWPRGWVSNLILGFSSTGILALLLLWPLRRKADNTWIAIFARRYFLALIPLVVMLLLALWQRLSEYGITEPRYLAAVLGLWLTGMVVYFLFRREANIKVIPASLALLAFLAAGGPWGAFSVSENNQVGRLRDLLERNGILVGGQITKAEASPPFADAKEISSILHYLREVHDLGVVEPWFGQAFPAAEEGERGSAGDSRERMVAALMGVRYIEEWVGQERQESYVAVDRATPFAVGGFDNLIRDIDFSTTGPDVRPRFAVQGVSYGAVLVQDSAVVIIRRLAGDSASATIELGPLLLELAGHPALMDAEGKVPASAMTADGEGGGMRVRLLIERVWRKKTDSGYEVRQLQGSLLMLDSTALPAR